MIGQVADDAAVFLIGDQGHALGYDTTQFLKLLQKIAHNFTDGGPIDLIVRQMPHLIDHFTHMLGEAVALGADDRDDIPDHADGPFLDAVVMRIALEDRIDVAQETFDIGQVFDFNQVEFVKIELRILGPQPSQMLQRPPRFLRFLGVIIEMKQSFERVGVIGADAARPAACMTAPRSTFRARYSGRPSGRILRKRDCPDSSASLAALEVLA